MVTRLFVQKLVLADNKEASQICVTGEFPSQRASNVDF